MISSVCGRFTLQNCGNDPEKAKFIIQLNMNWSYLEHRAGAVDDARISAQFRYIIRVWCLTILLFSATQKCGYSHCDYIAEHDVRMALFLAFIKGFRCSGNNFSWIRDNDGSISAEWEALWKTILESYSYFQWKAFIVSWVRILCCCCKFDLLKLA